MNIKREMAGFGSSWCFGKLICARPHSGQLNLVVKRIKIPISKGG